VNVSCEGDGLTGNHRNCNWIAKKNILIGSQVFCLSELLK